MPRHRPVERRRAIFIAVEGQSERAFIKFLGMCCEEKGLRLHPDVRPADGGDSVKVVQFAVTVCRGYQTERVIVSAWYY